MTWSRQCSRDGRHRGPVAGPWGVRVKPRRQVRAARQHDMVTGRMIVRPVGQRPHESPEMASLRQPGEMFANLDPRRFGRDRPKFAANLGGSLGLEIEALELRQSSRKKDVNDGPGFDGAIGSRPGQRVQGLQMIQAQPQHANCPGSNREATAEPRVLGRLVRRCRQIREPHGSSSPHEALSALACSIKVKP